MPLFIEMPALLPKTMKEFFGLLFFWGGKLFQEFVIFWKTVQKHVYVSKINFVVLGGGSQKSISKEQRGRFGSRQTPTTNRM